MFVGRIGPLSEKGKERGRRACRGDSRLLSKIQLSWRCLRGRLVVASIPPQVQERFFWGGGINLHFYGAISIIRRVTLGD
jgi:hypothetical protein